MARKLQHLQEKQSSLRPDPVGRPVHHPDRCRSSQSKPVAASSSTPPSITPSSDSIRPDTTKSQPSAAVCAATPFPDLIRPPVAQLETTGRLNLHSPEQRPLTLPSGTPSHAPTHTPDVASHSSGNLHPEGSHSASQTATPSDKTLSTRPSSIVVRIPLQEAAREVQDPVDTTNIAGCSHRDELCVARNQSVAPKESSDWPAAVSMHASIASKSPNTAARLDKAHRRSISESRLPHRPALQFELSEPEAASASVFEEPTPLTTSRAIHQDITPPEPRRIKGARLGACPFETTLAQATRRIPYGASDKPLVLSNKAARVLDLPSAADARLSEELARLYLTLLPSHDATCGKQAFIIKLERLLHHEWPDKDFTVHAFGSTENLLATDLSDLDVCITTSWQGFATQTCRLSSFMHRAGMQNVVCRAGAKVPVVAVFDPELKVACDMNINNTLALRNTRLVRVYMEIDTRARQLAYFVKYWAKRRALNDAVCNTLTSYSWTLLVINFLQVREPPVLPCLHSWPHDTVPSLQGIDVSFADDVDKYGLRGFGRHNHESIGSLLVVFFHYYTYLFNYRLGVASVRSGCVVDRASKGFHPDQLFGIEEPFTTSRNLGNTADMDSHRGIHLELARAHELLVEERTFESICTPYVSRGAKTRRYQLNGGIKQGPRRPNQAGTHQVRQSGRSGFYQPGNGQFGMHVADAMTADYGHFRHNNPEFHVNQGVPLEHLQFLQTAYPISLQYYQQMAQLMSAGAPQEDRTRTDRHRQQELWRRRQPLQNLQNLSEQQLQRQENQLGPSHFPHSHQQQQQQQQQQPHRQQRQNQQQQQQAHRHHQRPSQRNLREATMPTFQMLSLPVDMNLINRKSSPRSAQANLFQNQAHPDIKQSLPETLDQLPTAPAASPNGYLNHVTPYQRSVSLAYCDALVQGLDTEARHPAPHQAPVEQVPASECSASSTTGMTRESSSQSGSSRSSPSTSAVMLFLDGSAPMPTTEQGSKVGIDSSDHHDEDKTQRPVAVSNRLGYNHVAARRQASPVRHRSAFPPIDLAQTNPIRTVAGKPSYARVASKPSSPTAHTGPLLSPTRATVR